MRFAPDRRTYRQHSPSRHLVISRLPRESHRYRILERPRTEAVRQHRFCLVSSSHSSALDESLSRTRPNEGSYSTEERLSCASRKTPRVKNAALLKETNTVRRHNDLGERPPSLAYCSLVSREEITKRSGK